MRESQDTKKERNGKQFIYVAGQGVWHLLDYSVTSVANYLEDSPNLSAVGRGVWHLFDFAMTPPRILEDSRIIGAYHSDDASIFTCTDGASCSDAYLGQALRESCSPDYYDASIRMFNRGVVIRDLASFVGDAGMRMSDLNQDFLLPPSFAYLAAQERMQHRVERAVIGIQQATVPQWIEAGVPIAATLGLWSAPKVMKFIGEFRTPSTMKNPKVPYGTPLTDEAFTKSILDISHHGQDMLRQNRIPRDHMSRHIEPAVIGIQPPTWSQWDATGVPVVATLGRQATPISGGVSWKTGETIQTMSQRYHTLGTWGKPKIFHNLQEDLFDEIGRLPIKRLAPNEIRNSSGKLNAIWALEPDGTMHYGLRRYKSEYYVHTDLTGSRPVIAAGELFTWNGEPRSGYPNNKTGHYLCSGSGSSAERTALHAFRKDGFSFTEINDFSFLEYGSSSSRYSGSYSGFSGKKSVRIKEDHAWSIEKNIHKLEEFVSDEVERKPNINFLSLLIRSGKEFGLDNLYIDDRLHPLVQKVFYNHGVKTMSAITLPAIKAEHFFHDSAHSYPERKSSDLKNNNSQEKKLMKDRGQNSQVLSLASSKIYSEEEQEKYVSPIKDFMQDAYVDLLAGRARGEVQLGHLDAHFQSDPTSKSLNQRFIQGGEKFQKNQRSLPTCKDSDLSEEIVELNQKLDTFGVVVDAKLNHLIAHDRETRQSLNTACAYLQAQAKKEEAKERHDNIMECFGFIGALGQHTGNRDLCRISQIGGASLKIYESAKAISAASSLASLSTLASFCSMGVGVLCIIGALAKSKQGPDTGKIIMEAIRALAEQVAALHPRFDKLEKMIGSGFSSTMYEFGEMRLATHDISTFLKTLRREVLTGQIEIKASLETLVERLQVFAQMYSNAERKAKLDSLFKRSNRALTLTAGGMLQENFDEKLSDLEAEITSFSKDFPLVGQCGSFATVVGAHEADGGSEFCADFNIAMVSSVFLLSQAEPSSETFVTNPVVWCWQALTLMVHLRKQYALTLNPEKQPKSFMTKAELSRMKEVLETGKRLRTLLNKLKQREILATLCQSYVTSAIQLKTELAAYFSEQEAGVSDALDTAWRSSMDLFNQSVTDLFRHQKISVSATVQPGWFTHLSINHHAGGNTHYNNAQGKHGYAQELMRKYVTEQEQEISQRSEVIIQMVRRPLDSAARRNIALSGGTFGIFEPSKIEGATYQMLLFPRTEGQPVLLVPLNFKGKVPDILKKAMWYGLGNLAYYYRIVNQRFIISLVFERPDRNLTFYEFSVPYDPGAYPADSPEGIWRFWHGGTYCRDGQTHSVQRCPDDGPHWSNFTQYPTSRAYPGRFETLSENESMVLIELQASSEELRRIQLACENFEKLKISEVVLALKDKLKSDHASNLSKAVLEYSYWFYMLHDALHLAFHDHKEIKSQALSFFNETNSQQLLRHRSDLMMLLQSLQSGTESLSHRIDATMEVFTKNVQTAIALLPEDETCYYDLLQEMIDSFSSLLSQYETIAVDVRMPQNNSEEVERLVEQNREQAEVLEKQETALIQFEAAMRAVGSAMMEMMDPRQRAQFSECVMKHFSDESKKGRLEGEKGTKSSNLLPSSLGSSDLILFKPEKKLSPEEQFARDNNFILRDVPGDGNCFFSAIATLLNQQNQTVLTAADVRRSGVAYLRNHNELHVAFGEGMFEPGARVSEEEKRDANLNTYLAVMAQSGEYARGAIIDAVLLHYNISLDVIDLRDGGEHHVIHLNQTAEDQPLLTVLRIGENIRSQHYMALVAQHESSVHGLQMKR